MDGVCVMIGGKLQVGRACVLPCPAPTLFYKVRHRPIDPESNGTFRPGPIPRPDPTSNRNAPADQGYEE